MAVDTNRGRLRKPARNSVGGPLIPQTWTESAPHRIAGARIAARRRRTRSFAAAAVGIAALILGFRGPGEFASGIHEVAQRWNVGGEPTCAELPRRYDGAVRALGTGWEVWTREAFDRARVACERRAAMAASTARAEPCSGASTQFNRAFDRQRASATLAAVSPAPGSTIGMSAVGILGADDLLELEAVARRMVSECAD